MSKSLRLALNNWKVLLKSLFYQMLILAIAVALVITLFSTTLQDFTNQFDADLIDQTAGQINTLTSGGHVDGVSLAGNLQLLVQQFESGVQTIESNVGGLWVVYLLIIAVIVLYRMVISATDVVVGCQIYEFMTSNASRPFFWYAFKKAGKTWKFAFYQMLYTLPLDVLIVLGSVALYLVTSVFLGELSIIPVLIIALCFYSLRLTYFSFSLPSVVANEQMHTRKAVTLGLSQIVFRFWQNFGKILAVVVILFTCNVLLANLIVNRFVVALVSSALSFIFYFVIKCVNMVQYFEYNQQPYFCKKLLIEGTYKYEKRYGRNDK